jgi:hypothetical protein
MKKTAVEWLWKSLLDSGFQDIKNAEGFYYQAKEMEKRQIIEARVTAPLLSTFDKADYKEEAEQYYNETFKNTEQ